MIERAPRLLLRLEGAALACGALAIYIHLDYSILALVGLLVAVDLSLLGYLVGPRAGATSYNLAHTTVLPFVLGVAGILADAPTLVQIALAWLAHIGVDRSIGLGLKYPGDFKDTHLQRV
ncbi:MAG TPA: DUF4260 domain-containing protein [Solirubrobacterales bacterium]|nr:DUF4260 domain-containing protein [Solirubrobacterales bacterium]